MTRALNDTGLIRDGAYARVLQTEGGASVFVAGALRPDEIRHVACLAHEAAVNAEKRSRDSVLPAVVSPAGAC